MTIVKNSPEYELSIVGLEDSFDKPRTTRPSYANSPSRLMVDGTYIEASSPCIFSRNIVSILSAHLALWVDGNKLFRQKRLRVMTSLNHVNNTRSFIRTVLTTFNFCRIATAASACQRRQRQCHTQYRN